MLKKLSKVEVTNIQNKYDAEFIENLANEQNCKTEKYWQSKYNSLIKYDYEPFCSSGFTITLEISGEKEKIDFIKYLFQLREEKIKYLNKCLSA